MSLVPSYESPLDAVIMRTLAWEQYVAGHKAKVKQIKKELELIQAARIELVLEVFEAPSARRYIQELRTGESGYINKGNELLGFPEDWRLLYLPPHSMARQLSYNPVVAQPNPEDGKWQSVIELRNPAIPKLHFVVGSDVATGSVTSQKRGLYMLRLQDAIYIGKSDEFDVRIGHHFPNKKPLWWILFLLGQSMNKLIRLIH